LARTLSATTLVVAVSAGLLGRTPLANATFSTLEFTTSTGSALADFAVGDTLFVTIDDANRNTSSATAQSVELTLTAATSGDAEPMTSANGRAAVETGVDTGEFRNTAGYVTAQSDGSVAINDGVLELTLSDTVTASYADTTGESATFDYANSPLPHTAFEGGHVDDGSSADDPTATSCSDSSGYLGMLGAEGAVNFNDPANGAYIPIDRAKWDIPPGSKAGINDGPTISNIQSENATFESNKSITAAVTNPTGCHGWTLAEFDFALSPYAAGTLTNLDILWRGTATRDADTGLEPAPMNDLFLLVFNRTFGTWQQLDVEANLDVIDLSGPPYTNVSLTRVLTSDFGSYVDASGKLRLLVAAWDVTDDTAPAGGLYTDYVRVNATGNDVAADAITVTGGTILGTVWNDVDRDGVFDGNESGIANVTVSLLDAAGVTVVSDRTNADGEYGFIGFPAGTYNLLETDPSGFVSTTPNDLGPLNLAVGQTITGQDFGDAQQLSTTGLTSGYTVATFATLFAAGLGLLFIVPRVRRSYLTK
jgi:hypothetical protein